jgi:threonylcarbamoyladenosine tRNA methylthiotransferase CDKAL1
MIYPNTFHISTFGCTFNQADSTKICSILLDAKYLPTSIFHAEIIIFNTCAVKAQTEAKILHNIKALKLKKDQKILITGCLPWISKKLLSEMKDLNPNIRGFFDSNSLTQLLSLLESIRSSNTDFPIIKNPNSLQKAKISHWVYRSSDPGIVQISEGCNMSCTYCCTRISRGKAISYPMSDILNQIKAYIDNGTKEIYLTGQDCGFYQWNSHTIGDLVQKIHDQFNHNDIFIRVGMINPIRPSEIIDLTQKLINSNIFYNFLHIPIQSASNKILKLMQRGYSADALHKLFESIPKEITLSTDIICGFPGEEEEDFLQTYDFIQRYQPDIVNISKYTPRPNTKAKLMKQVDSNVIKRRTNELTKLYLQYSSEKNSKWIGWRGKVLIHGYQPKKSMQFSGRNIFYKSVVVSKGILNTMVITKVIDSSGQFLIGEILDY